MRIYFFTTRIMSLIEIQKLIEQLPEPQKDLVSDGYHSFKELYDHRIKLFVALCNVLENWDTEIGHPSQCWKSKLHSDGTMFDGWFIAGIGTEPWKTLTYHLPMSEWENMDIPEIDNAPEWDGHNSDDVLRLLSEPLC